MSESERYGVRPGEDFSSIILIRVFPDGSDEDKHRHPIGYVFEIDHSVEKEGKIPFWKMSAEHGEPKGVPTETPLETAVRGVRGEIGLHLSPNVFCHVRTERARRGDHWRCFFTADIFQSDLRMIHPYDKENEGEEARYFSVDEFWELVRKREFLLPHYNDMVNNQLVLPLGRDRLPT